MNNEQKQVEDMSTDEMMEKTKQMLAKVGLAIVNQDALANLMTESCVAVMTFNDYEGQHRAKQTEEANVKADRNRERAGRLALAVREVAVDLAGTIPEGQVDKMTAILCGNPLEVVNDEDIIDAERFIAAAVDFSDAGPDKFKPGYSQYRDLALCAAKVVAHYKGTPDAEHS